MSAPAADIPPAAPAAASISPETVDKARILAALHDAVTQANAALSQLVSIVQKYDDQYQASEKANTIMKPALDFARARVDDVRSTLDNIRSAPTYATETSVALAQQALQRANTSLLAIKTAAQEYDEKLQLSTTVWGSISQARDNATAAVADASARVEGVKDSIRATPQRYGDVVFSYASNGVITLTDTARNLDSRFSLTEKAKTLDERYSLMNKAGVAMERAAALDKHVTGGVGTRVMTKGYEMAEQGLAYLQQPTDEKTEETTAPAEASAQTSESVAEE